MSFENDMTVCDDGMDWLGAAPVADAEHDALNAVGRSAQMAVFSVLRAAYEDAHRRTGLSRRALSKKLRVSPALISRLLREPSNITVETAARVLFVLGHEFRVVDPMMSRRRVNASLARWSEPASIPEPIFQANIQHGLCQVSAERPQDKASVALFDEVDGPEIWVNGYGEKDGLYQPVPRVVAMRSSTRHSHPTQGKPHVDA